MEYLITDGEVLPYLSKSAKNMKMDMLLETPLPTYEGETPGLTFDKSNLLDLPPD